MIVHEALKQGSSEWWSLRLGRATASRFSKFLTAKRLDYSKGAHPFVASLVAERLLGAPVDDREVESLWTRRGLDGEPEARAWYEFYRDATLTCVGFVETDDREFGCSPDALVNYDPVACTADGGVEVKIRRADKHIACVLGFDPIADPLQVQASLWVTGLPWWDIVAFNPTLPKRIERHYPLQKTQDAITAATERLLADIHRAERLLEELGDVVDNDNELVAQLQASLFKDGDE